MISNRFIAETLSGAVEELEKERAKRQAPRTAEEVPGESLPGESRAGGGDEGKGFLFLSP